MVLGGTHDVEDAMTNAPTVASVQRILASCQSLVPSLQSAQVVDVWAGFRPERHGGARLETEYRNGRVWVHNYGHGGSGMTLHWGTAEVAADMVAAHWRRGSRL